MKPTAMVPLSPSSELPHAIFWHMKMKGITQSSLIRASDGHYYVIKQARGVDKAYSGFNESFGYELAASLNLPVPRWSPIVVSEEFIDKNRGLWRIEPKGDARPEPGLYFGSQLPCSVADTLLDGIPRALVSQVSNRKDFNGVLVLDIWANQADVRQALFITKKNKATTKAVFIDFEQCFRPGSLRRTINYQLYSNKNIYVVDQYIGRSLCGWGKKIMRYEESRLRSMAEVIPREWFSERQLINVIAGLLMRQVRMPEYIAQIAEILSLPSQRRPTTIRTQSIRECDKNTQAVLSI